MACRYSLLKSAVDEVVALANAEAEYRRTGQTGVCSYEAIRKCQ